MIRVLITDDRRGRENSWEASVHVQQYGDSITSARLYASGATEEEARTRLQCAVDRLREKLAEELK